MNKSILTQTPLQYQVQFAGMVDAMVDRCRKIDGMPIIAGTMVNNLDDRSFLDSTAIGILAILGDIPKHAITRNLFV
jgi:vacuolar-type H+-ATPase subunit E/Vma4